MTSHRPVRRMIVSALTATTLTLGVVAPAYAAEPTKGDASSQMSSDVKVKVNSKDAAGRPKVEEKSMPGYTQTSGAIGSTDLQGWYNDSPDWAQKLLGVLFVLAILDVIGTLIGPVRSAIFNGLRAANIQIPGVV